jgi:hypothetical protein
LEALTYFSFKKYTLLFRVSAPGRLATFQPEVGDAITCMEFNALRPSLIACGHSSGGVCTLVLKKLLYSYLNSF